MAALAVLAFGAQNANLAQVRSVYIMPMNGGMHQYLASRLVTMGLFEIVTDPNRADAVLTDKINDAFESRLADYDKKDEERAKPAEAVKKEDEAKRPAVEAGASNIPNFALAERPLTTSLGGGKGTFFLVDRKSRRLLWSVYEKPKNTTPGELHKVAGRVAEKMKDDWSGKK